MMKIQPIFTSRHNNVALAIHIVWTTQSREPRLVEAIEDSVYACILAEAQKLKCQPLAIGGMPDHVHLIVLLHPTISLSKLIQQTKGSSSHLINHVLVPGDSFHWATTYAAFSMSRRHRDRAVVYVQNQKFHHANQTVHPHWEPALESAVAEGNEAHTGLESEPR